jgi:Ca2+-binding EF-hand superfamily protein
MAATMLMAMLAWAADAPKPKLPPTPEETFRRLDADRNGKVSLEEFDAFLKGNPRLKTRSDWSNLFADIDANEDGSLSLEEFKTWAAKAKKKPTAAP